MTSHACSTRPVSFTVSWRSFCPPHDQADPFVIEYNTLASSRSASTRFLTNVDSVDRLSSPSLILPLAALNRCQSTAWKRAAPLAPQMAGAGSSPTVKPLPPGSGASRRGGAPSMAPASPPTVLRPSATGLPGSHAAHPPSIPDGMQH